MRCGVSNRRQPDFIQQFVQNNIIQNSAIMTLFEWNPRLRGGFPSHGVSNHRRLDCLFNHLFRRSQKKTSNHRVTGLCEGNSPVTSEFPAQRASNAENVSTWWRHHAKCLFGNNPSITPCASLYPWLLLDTVNCCSKMSQAPATLKNVMNNPNQCWLILNWSFWNRNRDTF